MRAFINCSITGEKIMKNILEEIKDPHCRSILKRMKKEAKQLKELQKIRSSLAHEIIAKSWGFNSYNHALTELRGEK